MLQCVQHTQKTHSIIGSKSKEKEKPMKALKNELTIYDYAGKYDLKNMTI